MLSGDEVILIGVILSALVLIIFSVLPPDLVAILVLLTLGFTGVVSTEKALAGFGSPVVITIIGLFIITHALDETGVIYRIAQRINQLGGGSEVRLILVFMSASAGLSLIMNNIAAGAVLLPAAVRVAILSNVRLSKLLIPLSFGTLVGGMATYFTTANIILSNLLLENGQAGLGMMDFVPTGGLIVVGSVIFMLLIGRRLLPNRITITEKVSTNLYETYQLGERMWEVEVQFNSRLVGHPLSESGIGAELGLSVLGIWRGTKAILTPNPQEVIGLGDYLLVMGREDRVKQMLDWGTRFRQHLNRTNTAHQYDIEVSEVIIPPRASIIGKTLKELQFRKKYRLTAIALWREGRSYRTDVGNFPLQVGDAILVTGAGEKIQQLSQERDYLVLGREHSTQPKHPEKAGWAISITLVAVLLGIFDVLPLAEVFLAAAAAMVITGCMDMNEAYRAVEWRVVFLIAGMLPISIAMVDTGLAEKIGDVLIQSLAEYGTLNLLAGLFFITVAVTQVLGGQVTALVVGPIAITTALQVGINPQATAVLVAIGCSTAFLTPIAHPVNVLMMGPAGYKFSDFFKVGVGMTAITFIILMLGMVLFWGIR